ncbi:MAG: phosphatidylglycerol:prolipoprotein diacylglycerol transferase [Kiritimatiellia bacterium]
MTPIIPYYERIIFHIPLPSGLPMESLDLHGFGILVALGFLLGGWVSMWRAERHGFDKDAINRMIGWLVLGTFVGGHVGYGLMYRTQEYLQHPEKFFYVWEGLSSIGGFAVCVPLAVWFFHRNKLPVWPNLDHLAVGFSLGWFFGRMGCTVAHDHPGTGIRGDQLSGPLNILAKYCRPVEGHTAALPSWAVEGARDLRWGPCVDGGSAVTSVVDMVPMNFDGIVASHDMGFYEALFSLCMLGVFLIMDRRPQVPGVYPLVLGLAYGPVRLAMDFLRPETTDFRWFGVITAGQAGSALIFVVSAFFLYRRLKSGDKSYWRKERPPIAELGPNANVGDDDDDDEGYEDDETDPGTDDAGSTESE